MQGVGVGERGRDCNYLGGGGGVGRGLHCWFPAS